MFTGIIETLGIIKDINKSSSGWRIAVLYPGAGDFAQGESISVDGVCLTVAEVVARETFAADLSVETISRTAFSLAKPGKKVNLERAVRLNERMGGHMVSGHVDGVGKIASRKVENNTIFFDVETPPNVEEYLIPKGSIALDGISLTIGNVDGKSFEIAIIPHTMEVTTLGERRVGDLVNLEADLIGKYVRKFMEPHLSGKSLTEKRLKELGFG